MKMTIKPAAVEYIQGKINDGQRIFLALDDGSSKFSKLGGSCAIGNKFQLVLADNADSDYTTEIENNSDYKVYTSGEELTFLGNGLSLDYKNAMLKLSDNSGILDGAVTIDQAPDEVASKDQLKEDMQTIGVKNC